MELTKNDLKEINGGSLAYDLGTVIRLSVESAGNDWAGFYTTIGTWYTHYHP